MLVQIRNTALLHLRVENWNSSFKNTHDLKGVTGSLCCQMMKKMWLCKVSGSAFMANICEYFELHLLVPLSISVCTRECSLLKTGLILVLQCGGRLLLWGQNIRCYTT